MRSTLLLPSFSGPLWPGMVFPKDISSMRIAKLAGAVQYTDCIFAAGVRPTSTSVLNMVLNNMMVRLKP